MTKDPCPYMPSLFLSESQAPFGSLTHQLCNSKSPTSERQKNPARGPGCRAQSAVYFCCWPPCLSLLCLGSPWVCCCGVGAGDAGFCVSLDDGVFVIVCSFQRNLSTIQLLAEAGILVSSASRCHGYFGIHLSRITWLVGHPCVFSQWTCNVIRVHVQFIIGTARHRR